MTIAARVLDLSVLTSHQGFTIQGKSEYDFVGFSVSAGDVNGDGIDDIILGAPLVDNGGEAYVIFGRSGPVRREQTST